LELIRRTGREFGISIILSTHLMGDVESTCERIIVLDEGRMKEAGDVSMYTKETQNIFIDVDDNRSELVTALLSRGIEATIEGSSIAVVLENEVQSDGIRDAIVEVDAQLRRMGPRRQQLAGIFWDDRK
jgi:ABC-2 type transport system ATP-binding protein